MAQPDPAPWKPAVPPQWDPDTPAGWGGSPRPATPYFNPLCTLSLVMGAGSLAWMFRDLGQGVLAGLAALLVGAISLSTQPGRVTTNRSHAYVGMALAMPAAGLAALLFLAYLYLDDKLAGGR